MGANILSLGQSALAAAQLGISTTGQNIANASTPGYSREVVLQSASASQQIGGVFLGQGVNVTQIQRQYDQYIAAQVNTATTSTGQSSAYLSQISGLNNIIDNSTSGVSPSLQTFFTSIQNMAASPNGTAGSAARQATLSSAQALVGSINGLQSQVSQISADVNGQITSTVGTINGYATQLAQLNDAIAKTQSTSGGAQPNDLLDQRDYLVTQLSQLTSVSVVSQGSQYNVFIGNGQPLVLGNQANPLQAVASPTDPSRMEVAYQTNGKTVQIAENGLPGGTLGGLLDFRSNMLDTAQNSIGRVAVSIASSLNQQQSLGQDLNGQTGTNLFAINPVIATPSGNNTGSAQISATITNVSALTTSDYSLLYSGGKYTLTRMSDGTTQTSATLPISFDGVNFQLSPPPAAATPANGDQFLIRPTAGAAATMSVAITDPSKLAVATPYATSIPSTNTGTGQITSGTVNSPVASGSVSVNATISPVTVDASYVGNTLASPVTLTAASGTPPTLSGFPATATVSVTTGGVTTNYPPPATVPYTSGAKINFSGMSFSIQDNGTAPANGDTFTLSPSIPTATATLTFNSANNTISGFPATANVTVTNGTASTTYPAGTAVPYTSGATYSYNGVGFSLSGSPANGDVFKVGPNTNGTGDNRNALLMQQIQTQNGLVGGTTTIQGAYAQFVSLVGNKTNEVQATNTSEQSILTSASNAQQSVSGVNLDEEATNLLKYQQAYQAAGKLMQIASQLFSTLLAVGQ